MSLGWVVVPSPALRDSGFRLTAQTPPKRLKIVCWRHNRKECPAEISGGAEQVGGKQLAISESKTGI